jgi:hypothetical protein
MKTITLLAAGPPIIDSQAFGMILLLGFIFITLALVIGWGLGYKQGRADGYGYGWDDAEEAAFAALDAADEQWMITEEGRKALRDAKLAEVDEMILTKSGHVVFHENPIKP